MFLLCLFSYILIFNPWINTHNLVFKLLKVVEMGWTSERVFVETFNAFCVESIMNANKHCHLYSEKHSSVTI